MPAPAIKTCPQCGGGDVQLRLLTSYGFHWSCVSCHHTWRETQDPDASAVTHQETPSSFPLSGK